MKSFAPIFALVPLAACDPAITPPPAPAGQPQSNENAAPAACALEVQFGSYAMGIDRPTLGRVEALLARDAAVTKVERRPWGREGEVTLCASVGTAAEADRVARAVAALFPADPRGPLSVTTASGLVLRAGR